MTAEQNKEAFRRLFDEVFSGGDLAALDELVAPDTVENQAGMQSGREGVKRLVQMLRGAFPDLRYTIEDLTAEGDKVWGRVTARGTNTGSFMGHQPTGRSMTITVIDICRFATGQMVEHWGVADTFGALAQLRLIPRPQPVSA
ncbi:MAG: ester cyclase [Thermomicrobiales bacterium]